MNGISISVEAGYNYTQGDANTPITTPVYPASHALRVGGGGLLASYNKFRQGILFTQDALFRGSDGINGNAHAIALAKGHQIEWFSANTVKNATIRSDATSVSNQDISVIFNNNVLDIDGAGEAKIASFNHVANGVNYTKITNAITASFPIISFDGSDTNVGGFFHTKGTGQVRFLSHAGTGLNLYIVPPSTAPVNPVTIAGGTSGNGAVISVAGETNVALALVPKGTGAVTLRGAAGSAKVTVDDTGLGFYGATPAAKQSVSGSRGGNAALADLCSKLATIGLITDSTSA